MRWLRATVVLLLAACGAATGGGWTTTGTVASAPALGASPQDPAARRPAPRRRAAPSPSPAVVTPETDAAHARDGAPADPPAPGTFVVGRVVDASDAPMYGASVRAFVGISAYSDSTNRDGTFEIHVHDPTGVVRWVAWDDACAVQAGPWTELNEGDRIDVGTIRLAAAAPIRGVVLDDSGMPIDDRPFVEVVGSEVFDAETWALVQDCLGLLTPCGGSSHDVRDGRFEIDSLPAGTYRLAHGAEGEPQVVTAPAEDVVFRVAPPATVPETDGDDADAAAPPAGVLALAGRVTSGGVPVTWTLSPPTGSRGCYGTIHGTPVEVTARRTDGVGRPVETCTAHDGTFRIEGLDDAEYEVTAWPQFSEDRREFAPRVAVCRPGDAAGDLDLPRAGSRRFALHLPGDARPDEIDAWAEPCEDRGPDATDVDWPDDGTVLVTGLLPGARHRLLVRARVGTVWTAWTRLEDWTAGEAPIDVHLDEGLRIAGRVVGADGLPRPGAYLFAWRAGADGNDDEHDADECTDAYADLDGRFTLTGLAPGLWRVRAYTRAFTSGDAPLTLCAGDSDVRIVVATSK